MWKILFISKFNYVASILVLMQHRLTYHVWKFSCQYNQKHESCLRAIEAVEFVEIIFAPNAEECSWYQKNKYKCRQEEFVDFLSTF